MARRVTLSQFKSMIRQAEQKQRQAINKYNQEVRKHNQNVKRAIDDYNRKARAHNAQVQANRQKLKSELSRVSQVSTTTKYTVYYSSVQTLHASYERLEERAGTRVLDESSELLLNLSERETANSIRVANALRDDKESPGGQEDLSVTTILNELRELSPDLDSRWRGAVFALNPRNPDAARHFCISAREIFTQILEMKASDIDVLDAMPNCTTIDSGKPTRRVKIRFLLSRKGILDPAVEEFVNDDMENILELFRIFNDGAHGSAGKFGFAQLSAIKQRVEDGIQFLHHIALG